MCSRDGVGVDGEGAGEGGRGGGGGGGWGGGGGGGAGVGVCSCWLLSLRRAGICVAAHPGQKGQPALSSKADNSQLASQPVQVLFNLHACVTALHCLGQSDLQKFKRCQSMVGTWHG